MGSVTKLADRRPSTDPRYSLTFDSEGDFVAYHDAEAYLKSRGFSIGEMQAHAPTGVYFGESKISKWRNLSSEDKNDLHGTLTAISFRHGPVTISIREDSHSSVIEAFRSTISEGGTADPVGADLADAHPVIDGLDGEHVEDIRAQLAVEHRNAGPIEDQRDEA